MNRVMVIQLARLGDLVQTVPLLSTLKSDSETHLTLVVDERVESAVRNSVPYDELISIDLVDLGNEIAKSNILSVYQKFSDKLEPLRKGYFDKLYNLNFANINAALASQICAREILGFVPSRDFGGFRFSPAMRILFNQGHNRKTARVHLADLFRNLVKDSKPIEPPFYEIAESGLVFANKLKEKLQLSIYDKIITLHPGAGAEIRKLGAEKFARLIALLTAREDCRIVLVGNDRAEADSVLKLVANRERVVDLTGKTDIDELAGVLSIADLMIGADSGPLQLAAGVGTRCLGLFFASALMYETGPLGKGHVIIQSQPDCAPCLEDNPVCDDFFCRDMITPELILDITSGILNKRLSETIPEMDIPRGIGLYESSIDESGQKYTGLSGSSIDEAAFYRKLWFELLNTGQNGEAGNFTTEEINLAESEIVSWAENPLYHSLVQHYAMIAESEGKEPAVREFYRLKKILSDV